MATASFTAGTTKLRITAHPDAALAGPLTFTMNDTSQGSVAAGNTPNDVLVTLNAGFSGTMTGHGTAPVDAAGNTISEDVTVTVAAPVATALNLAVTSEG